jgi:hypothetical protein
VRPLRASIALALGVLVLPASGVFAADPARTCASSKLKAALTRARATGLCHAKAIAKNVAPDGECLAKAAAKYVAAWDKLEAKGGCASTGDRTSIEGTVDGFVDELLSALPLSPASCTPACGANAFCEAATGSCQCVSGFLMQGGVCQPAPAGHPSTHTRQDVCDHWSAGHVVTEPDPVVASGMDCDAGDLRPGARTDTLARVNMYRWLVGLGPTFDDPSMNAEAQLCANLEAWWDFSSPASPHDPPASAKCYTAAGAAAAGQSNIDWGVGDPAAGIDEDMQDAGNATTLGHRRWLINPPLGPIGIGFWKTGGMFGDAECVSIFGTSGTGQTQPWVSIPNAGFSPLTLAQWTWSFHGSLGGVATATIAVRRVDDDTVLPVDRRTLLQGFAEDAISWTPSGWVPEAGKTYRVTVSGLTGGDVVYDVKPVVCN